MAERRIPLVTYEYNRRVVIGEAVVDVPDDVQEMQADRHDAIVQYLLRRKKDD